MWMLSGLWPLPLSPCDKWLQHRESMSQSSVALSAKLWNIILVHALNLKRAETLFCVSTAATAAQRWKQPRTGWQARKCIKKEKTQNWRCLESFQKVLREYEKDVEQEANKYYKFLFAESLNTCCRTSAQRPADNQHRNHCIHLLETVWSPTFCSISQLINTD